MLFLSIKFSHSFKFWYEGFLKKHFLHCSIPHAISLILKFSWWIIIMHGEYEGIRWKTQKKKEINNTTVIRKQLIFWDRIDYNAKTICIITWLYLLFYIQNCIITKTTNKSNYESFFFSGLFKLMEVKIDSWIYALYD